MSVCRTVTTLAVGAAVATAAAITPQGQQFLGPSNDTEWHKFVRAPSSRIIAPAAIVPISATGNVSGVEAFANGGNIVLTRLNEDDLPPQIVFDFGLNIAGQLAIDFAGSYTPGKGRPGIRLAFSETRAYLGDRSDFTRSDNDGHTTGGTDQIAVEADPYTWIDQLGCKNETGKQVCSDGTHGFRYLRISLDAVEGDKPYTSPIGIVSISHIALHFSPFLGTPDTFTSHFECSDTDLTQWWYDAVYTNELCIDIFRKNNTEPRGGYTPTLDGKLVLHDGPKRDRDPYIGDIAVAGLTTYISHSQAAIAAANVIADLAEHQREDGWIPPASIDNYGLPLFDYPLWWIVSLYDYVMYTGNTSFAAKYYPVMVKALDKFYPTHTDSSTGLLKREHMGDFAFLPRDGGAATYYNSLYVHALNKAGEIATFLNKSGDANRWWALTLRLRPALLKRNWDMEAGAFWDGVPCDGAEMCPIHSQDGNSLAIIAGVTHNALSHSSVDVAESALAYLEKHMRQPWGNSLMDGKQLDNDHAQSLSTRVYAFTSYFELMARLSSARNETVASGFDQLRRMYGWMAHRDPGMTFWEGIGTDGGFYEGGFTSMAHGWSTGIVALMMNFILGITPVAPGFKQWSIKPVTEGGGLTWARGQVGTPYGAIGVAWQKASSGATTNFDIEVPANTAGTLQLSILGGEETIVVDGKSVFSRSEGALVDGVGVADGYVSIPLEGGRRFLVSVNR